MNYVHVRHSLRPLILVIRAYLPGLTETNLKDLLDLYPLHEFTASTNLSVEFYRSSRIFRDVLMVCPSLHLGDAVARTHSTPVFHYNFNQTVIAPIVDDMNKVSGLRVGHTSEFAYVFDSFQAYNDSNYPVYPSPADYGLMERVSGSWSTFAVYGCPSSKSTDPPHTTLRGWTRAYVSRSRPHIMTIGGPHEGLSPAGGPTDQRLDERCGFLNNPAIIKALGY
jgi:carboxylesterase type B